MGNEETAVIQVRRSQQVYTIALNRPENHNAMTPTLLKALTTTFQELGQRDDIRVVVLTGNGRSFCAGADLTFMKAASDYSVEENIADGHMIFDLMHTVNSCSKPVIGRINGAAIGGGIGLVSCCDIVIAVERAVFGFSEARLGIVPAVISPFVLARIGVKHARELFLTGERFGAAQAQSIGLVNHVVADESELDRKIEERIRQLLQAGPNAQAAAKALIHQVAFQPPELTRDYTAELIAVLRAGAEGREGMSAFLEKRKPYWQENT